MGKVRDRRLISTYGSRVLDGGFYSIPNLILDYQKELDLSNAELVFFIKVTHFFKRDILKDVELRMPMTDRHVKRVRKSLIDKGYLKCETIKSNDEDGKIRTEGIRYDWTGMMNALERLPRGQYVPSYNEHRGDILSGASLYGKECNVKEVIINQKNNYDDDDLILKLTKRGMDGDVARDLVKNIDHNFIREKIALFDKLEYKITAPGAWLRKAIGANDGEKVEKPSKERLTAAKERYEKIKQAVKDGKDVIIYDTTNY